MARQPFHPAARAEFEQATLYYFEKSLSLAPLALHSRK
jgi:hypothetical protein